MDMKWRDAIRKVLQQADEPMHYTVIAQEIIDNGYRKKVGATPAATVAAQLATPPLSDEVMKPERGWYEIAVPKSLTSTSTAPTAEQLGADESPAEPVAEIQTMGLINAFGMYWQRSRVDWSKTAPALLGVQQSGSEPVNFCDQVGVYLLHDGNRVIYVGRVTTGRLGKRLRDHTRGRLSGRWDRFTWFGVRPVGDDGKLGGAPPAGIDVDTLIATMEALLIEGLEPPLNRQQGDEFNALEFIQQVDPDIEKQLLKAQIDLL